MRHRSSNRSKSSSEASNSPGKKQESDVPSSSSSDSLARLRLQGPKRSSYVMLTLFVLVIYSSWSVHHYQFDNLPAPLTAEQAGKRGFSEYAAMKHVQALTGLGPHSVGSHELDLAVQYVLSAAEMIKNTSYWEVDVEVELFHVKSGANCLQGGLFNGRTLIYADLNHVIMRFSPRYAPEARENAILVSSHIDTVFSTGGAGDCSSCIAVMLELSRGISQWAHSFKNSIIVLFNTGEEEGLSGAYSFMTQHPWSDTIRMAIDLEAMGIGGKSSIFQTGPNPLAIENFALAAKHPSGQIMAQDLFTSGAIKSATDFQVYREVGGLSGLDFAYTDNTAVYHTRNDKMELLNQGSLQHLGENMLPFLLRVASLADVGKSKPIHGEGKNEHDEHDPAIYFDILGMYMVVYRQKFAKLLHNSVIMQSLLIWSMSLFMGGLPALISLFLSFLSVILMWILSVSSSLLVAFMLSYISSSAVPYVGHPWLVVGLFGSPALLGALAGQYIGFRILQMYLASVYSKGKASLSTSAQATLAKLEAERWLYKSGFMQWLVLLTAANYYNLGSSYIALVWLISPAFSYGLLEATLSPARLPKSLKLATLLMGLAVPIVLSAGSVIRTIGVLIGSAVRLDRNPGALPDWLVNVIVSGLVAAVVCLMLVYLLSYVHLSGAKRSIIAAPCILFGVSLAAVLSGLAPPYTEDFARAVNVVHVVDTTGTHGRNQDPISYISLSSSTPGKLTKEIDQIDEGFVCGRNMTVDFVTFSTKYGCWVHEHDQNGWSELDIPIFQVKSDLKSSDNRITQVSLDTKASNRWALAINSREINDFEFQGDTEELVPLGNKGSVDGWHIIQFAGGKKSPNKFTITLHWAKNWSSPSKEDDGSENTRPLLKLRTDVNRLTPKVKKIMSKLPSWCSLFGKSTSPYNLAFLANLPIHF
ncbi:hypothetical protein V2J09_001384 [Rumex salicifolius]